MLKFLTYILPLLTSYAIAQTDTKAPAPAAPPSVAPAAEASAPASPSANSPSGGLFIKISEAGVKKSLMALPSFQFVGSPSSKNGVSTGKALFDTFRNDMDVSGFFDFIKSNALPKDAATAGLKPAPGETGGFSYDYYKQIGTEFLVRVGYHMNGNDLIVDAYVYYVPQQKLVLGKTYKASADNARTVAHTFANDVVKALTGQPGSFLSKIVVSRSTTTGVKEIFVMDWDGANMRQITRHGTISQSPTWSWDSRSIAYSSMAMHNGKSRNTDLFTYDLETGKRFAVSYRDGVNSGPDFFPDNRHILLTISNSETADLYKMTLDGKSVTKLTNAKRNELNVEGTVSPDGSKIAFSSDRTGNAMVYVMNADGSNVKRMTIAGKYNSTPAWSPDGKKIAFAGMDSSHFDIFLMNADGTNMSRLTSATKSTSGKMSNNEDPSFSPDGRNVIFRSDRTGKYQLYITTLDGENERRITFDQHSYFRPRWSHKFD